MYSNVLNDDNYTILYFNNRIIITPKILYKFRDWANPYHQQIITESILYLPSPSEFEDKKDCFPLIYQMNEVELTQYYTGILPFVSTTTNNQWVNQCVSTTLTNNELEFKNSLDYVKESIIDKRIGVLSLTTDPQNPEMWEKYGAKYTGFCIGFDAEELFKCIGEFTFLPVNYCELDYVNYLTDNRTSQTLKMFFQKEPKWAFEKEYRICRDWGFEVSKTDRCIKLSTNCIKEIIPGPKMNLWARRELNQALQEK